MFYIPKYAVNNNNNNIYLSILNNNSNIIEFVQLPSIFILLSLCVFYSSNIFSCQLINKIDFAFINNSSHKHQFDVYYLYMMIMMMIMMMMMMLDQSKINTGIYSKYRDIFSNYLTTEKTSSNKKKV